MERSHVITTFPHIFLCICSTEITFPQHRVSPDKQFNLGMWLKHAAGLLHGAGLTHFLIASISVLKVGPSEMITTPFIFAENIYVSSFSQFEPSTLPTPKSVLNDKRHNLIHTHRFILLSSVSCEISCSVLHP